MNIWEFWFITFRLSLCFQGAVGDFPYADPLPMMGLQARFGLRV